MKRLVGAALCACLLSFSFGMGATPARADFTVNSSPGSHQFPAIANFANGSYVVAWRSFNSGDAIRAQLYGATGAKVGGEIVVSDFLAGDMTPKVATFSDGNFIVVWYAFNGGVRSVLHRIYNASGAPLTGILLTANDAVSTSGSLLDVAVLKNDSIVVTWEAGGGDIEARRLKKDGSYTGSPFTVGTTAGLQNTPGIAALTNGSFVITWASDNPNMTKRMIWAQRYTAGGAISGVKIQVPAAVAGKRWSSEIAPLPSGGFVIVWNQYVGTALHLRGQRFKATGVKDGVEFPINTKAIADDATSFSTPSVVALADGRFIVAWGTGNAATGKRDVMAQRFLATGVKSGVNTVINTIRTGDQYNPVLGRTNTTKGFVAVWDSFGSESDINGIRLAQ